MNNEECIARLQHLCEEMYDLVRELALSDQYQDALDKENRQLIEENRELKKELEILRAKTGRAQDFQITEIASSKDAQVALVVKLWREDKNRSTRTLASMTGVSNATIARWLKHYRDQEEQIKDQLKEGENRETQVLRLWNEDRNRSTQTIAAMTGIPKSTVAYYLKPYRDQEEQIKLEAISKDERNAFVFNLLDNGAATLSIQELALKTNIPQATVWRIKQRWLELHGATEQGEPYGDESAS